MPDITLKTAFLQLPTRILNDLAEGKSAQVLGEAICRFAEGFVPGRIATVMALNTEGRLVPWAGPNAPAALMAALDGLQPGPHAGSCGHAVYSQNPTLVTEIERDERWNDLRDLAEEWKLHSCWSYPVWLDGRVAGTFALTSQAPGAPADEALELLEFCAAMTGTVLRYAQMRAAEETQRGVLTRALQFNAMLAQVNQVIAEAEYPHELFQAVCDIAIKYGHFRLAFLGVPDGQRRMRIIASSGETGYLEGLAISIDPEVPEGRGSIGRCWRERTVQYNQSFASAPHLQPWQERAARFGLGASATIPILRQGVMRGVLSVYHQEVDIFDESLSVLLEELALDVARGLERIILRRRLQHEQHKQEYLSVHDALTGLPNRLALEHHFPGALARARKDRTVLAVGLADLDDFKAVNDLHGREAGDLLIKRLAQRLRAAVRDTDLVVRSGGDEFVFVVENLLRYDDLFPRLEELAAAFHDPVELPGIGPVTPRVSLGLTFYPDDQGDGGQLLRHAFEAMHGLKDHKATRSSWWQIWGEGQLRTVDFLPRHVPPYGEEAAALLHTVQEALAPLAARFSQHFREEWMSRPDLAAILPRLTAAEQDGIMARSEQHIRLLQHPDLSEAEHRQRSENLGRRNTLLGLDHTVLIEATQSYHDEVRRCLHEHQGMRLLEKQQVTDIIEARLRVELQSQLRALRQLLLERQSWLSQQSLQLAQATGWVDACRTLLEAATGLDGWVAATINRLDASGRLEYEFKTPVLDRYLEVLQERGIVPHVQDSREAAQPAAHLRVWQTERIETNVSYATEDHLAHLREAALSFGIRSAAFVPITDAQGRIAATFGVFGHHPGQFESVDMRLFLQSLGHLLSQARQRLYRPQLTAQNAEQRRLFRESLEQGALVLHYQPIVDLQSGLLTKVEALARIRLPDGSIALPGAFLPGFGSRELVLLFQQGLDLALSQLVRWLPERPGLTVSLNLPPPVLVEPECAAWVEAALDRHRVAPQQLELEVLEDEEFHDLGAARDCLQCLSMLGVQLVMDDLGAGYSSLVRLRHLPFSTVKIDQGLVREIARDPERVIDFISGLVRLAKSLRLRVIVEGLESPDLVEVASLLGADEGQGYALARPMEPDSLMEWLDRFSWNVLRDHPATALGRLALHKRGY
ncbi:MAG: EAL domain-containing protein [Betaproteobacteria bacterium]|nr:EAL domain-containing protein [Betaproteobacteria bacterium]MDE2623218.1 EAL domain-containing protein [Betaproteobacteria bacterium]